MEKSNTNSNENINVKDWEIDEKVAKKMIYHRREAGNDTSNIIDYNDTVLDEITKAYPKNALIAMEEARYKDDEDEIRYCRMRKIPDENNGNRGKQGKVKGYKTKIYKVTVTNGLSEEADYYDIVTIKPPPPEDK
ncbi:MAG TPA: hypothetical protein VGP43_05290 [Chitinophagaceae bacterium]|nr:hypothetical protein [Chitinophagaceae bacterium]